MLGQLITHEEMDEYSEFVRSRFAFNGYTPMDIMHCILGIYGEYFEVIEAENDLEEANQGSINSLEKLTKALVKEQGDQFFYFRALFNLLNVTNSQLEYDIVEGPGTLYKKLENGYQELIDEVKKCYFYNQANTKVPAIAITLWKQITWNWICEFGEDWPKNVMLENIKKLTKRYPQGFSTQASIEKADRFE